MWNKSPYLLFDIVNHAFRLPDGSLRWWAIDGTWLGFDWDHERLESWVER